MASLAGLGESIGSARIVQYGRAFFGPLQAWRVRALIIGVCVALLAAAASVVPIAWSWEEGVDLYLLFRARGPRPVPDDVVLIPIDGQATRRLFLPAAAEDFERCRDVRLDEALPGYRNPDPPEILTRFPRCLHARALQALALAKPEAVIMDISFRPRSDPSGAFSDQDRELAAAMRAVGKIVLVRKIKSDPKQEERAQPIAGEIETAALAIAPFLVVGDQLQRADKFCTFKEDHGWAGPCLPAVAHQVASLAIYPELRKLLGLAASENVDLMPAHDDALVADGALQAPVRLIRHLAISDKRTGVRVRELLASADSTPGRLQSLTEIYLGPGTRYFNFYGPPPAFPILRYETLVAGPEAARPSPGSLRGKVVFIGFAEYDNPEPIEHFTTPFTTAESIKLSGVELAATAYANLQDGSAVEPVAWWARALIVLLLSFVCTLLCVTLRAAHALPLCLAVGLAYFAAALGLFDRYALWLPLLMPLGFAAPVAVSAGIASSQIELKRRLDRSYQVLVALLPRRVVDRIINDNQKLAEQLGQLREKVYGTCVFTDLQGFTAFGEERPPDEVARVMSEYFQALFLVVEKIGGETSDTAGDGMLAVWADIKPDAALHRRACSAALQLAEAAERFSALPTRIGVDYGPMSRGMLGGSFHVEYRHMGDVPNTANRLQRLSKQLGARLLVSEAVIKGLDGPDGFLVRHVGHFKLPGKEHPTQVYQLIGERVGAEPQQLRLCETFAEALAEYQKGDCASARALLEALLLSHPGDGPALFYARLCTQSRSYGTGPIPVE